MKIKKTPFIPILIVWIILAIIAGIFFLQKQIEPKTIVMIDPGHGGYDSGATGADGTTYEKDLTMEISYKIGQQIQHLDPSIKVVFTRLNDQVSWPSEVVSDLQTRIDLANKNNADFFLSIHLNSGMNPNAYGYNSFVRENDPFSQEVALHISEQLDSIGYSQDRGTQTTSNAPLMVVDQQTIPAMLFEVGFISNMNEMEQLKSSIYQNKIAHAIAQAVVDTVHAQISKQP